MTAFERAQGVYEREACARSFFADLHHHLMHGYVYSSPTAFGMVREVAHDWPASRLLTPWDTALGGDCWMVWLLAGDAREAMGKLPHAKKWLAMERGGSLYTVHADKFLPRLARASLRCGPAGPG